MIKLLTTIFKKLTGNLRKRESPIIPGENADNNHEKIKDKEVDKKRKSKGKNQTTPISTSKKSLYPISPQKMKLISLAGDIGLDPDNTESAFMARQLVQATLPHKNPGNVPDWSRKNGDLTLTIRPGWNTKNKTSIGYPYGTLPRLLLFWIITEAVRTKNPCIELGESLSSFMKKLGLDSSRGGKRSDAKRLKEQMIRLFRSTISFEQSSNGRDSWLDMQIAPKGALCWDERYADQDTQWENYIQLSDDFFKAVTSAPVPIDIRALKGLRNSSLALDLYSWATYTTYQAQKNKRSRYISWDNLHKQFGAEYSDIKDFSKKAWSSLLKVNAVYPNLKIKRIRGGVEVFPSQTAISSTEKKKNRLQK